MPQRSNAPENLPTGEPEAIASTTTSVHVPPAQRREAEKHHGEVRNPFYRALGLLGLIAILLLGAWGIITVALYLPTAFSKIGDAFTSPFSGNSQVATSTKERIDVSASSATSGMPFTLSWNHTGGNGNYSYQVSYACQSGVSLDAPLPNGSFEKVSCNTPFDYVSAKNSMVLVPHVTGNKSATVLFSVSATLLSTGKQSVSGSATVTIAPGSTSSSNTGSTSSNSGYGATKGGVSKGGVQKGTQTYNGPADLSVQIMSVNASGAQFRISNVGGTTVPAGWNFSATLPSGFQYTSPAQAAITPGSGVINTLSWNQMQSNNCYNSYPQYQYNYQYPQNCYNNYGYQGPFTITINVYDVNPYNNSASANSY